MATGDNTSIEVISDADSIPDFGGYILRIETEGFTTGQTVDVSKITVTALSDGYDSSGNFSANSVTRNLTCVDVLRQADPNEANPSEATTVGPPAGAYVDVVLSDVVFDDDTFTVTMEAGAITNDGGSSETSAAITDKAGTNNSEHDYPICVAQWDEVGGVCDRDDLTSDFVMAIDATHNYGVACVIFDADGASSANNEGETVTAPTKHQLSNSELYTESYQTAALTLSGFTQGETINGRARVYPVVGDADSVLDTNDHTTLANECQGRNRPQYRCNKDGVTTYAYCRTSGNGGDDATGVASTTEQDAIDNPFESIRAAIEAIGTSVGGLIKVTDGMNAVSEDGTFSPAGQTSNSFWIRVTPTSGSVTLTMDTGANFRDVECDRLWYDGFTIDFTDGASRWEGAVDSFIKFTDCDFTNSDSSSAQDFSLTRNQHLTRLHNCTGIGVRTGSGTLPSTIVRLQRRSSDESEYHLVGCDVASNNNGTALDTVFRMVACDCDAQVKFQTLPTSITVRNNTNVIIRNNNCPSFDGGSNNGQFAFNESNETYTGISVIGNKFEQIGSLSSNIVFGNENTQDSILVAHNTFAGSQCAIAYNEDDTTSAPTTNMRMIGNVWNNDIACKGDVFDADTTDTFGNWAALYGVGWIHNHIDNALDDYGSVNTNPPGLDVTDENDQAPSALFEDDQSIVAAGSGGGDYTPASGSVLLNRLTIRAAKFDMNGVEILTGGNGAIGAIQPDPAPTVTGATINAAGNQLTITTSVATDIADAARMDAHFTDDTNADIRATFRKDGAATNSTSHVLDLLGDDTVLDGEATLYLHFNAGVVTDTSTSDPNVATTTGDGVTITNNSTQKLTDAYVDADAVNGVGGGTESEPFDTIAKAVATVATSGTIHVQGTFRGAEAHTLPDNVTLQQWAGETQCVIRGDTILGTGAWTDEGGGVFSADVGSDTVGSVVWNWDANLDSNYDSPSHLKPGTHGSLSEGEWGQSGTELQIFPWSGSQDPDTGDVYAYTTEAVNLLRINNSTNPTVSGVHAYLASDPTGAQGYGIFMNDCVNPTVKDCVVVDAGTHSIGLVNNSGGSAPQLDSGLVSNCTVSGITPATGSNQIVVFSNDTDGGVDGVIVDGCTFRLRTLLAGDGDPIDQTSICTGAFWHNGAGNTIKDILWKNCTFVGVDGFNSNICGNGDTTAAPSDNEVWADYAVRFEDCTATNCTTMDLAIAGAHSVGFRRCFFDMQRAAIKGGIISGSVVVMMRLGTSGASTKDFLFESCAFVFDVREFYSSSSFVGAGSGDEFPGRDNSTFVTDVRGMWVHQATNAIFQNCHVHKVNDSNSADYEHVYGVTATSYWKWIDTVFTSTTTGHFGIGATQTQANLSDSDGNLWYNIDTNEYWASGTAFDTEAEWLANIDTNGKYSQDPGIDGIGDTGTPTATGYSSGQLTLDSLAPDGDGYVRTTPSFRSGGVLPRGINGRKYSGQLGPFQYGGGGGRSRSRSRRR